MKAFALLVNFLNQPLTAIALFVTMLATSSARAADCFILVHGHGAMGTDKLVARDTWRSAEFLQYEGSDFLSHLLVDSDDNYGIVGYDSTDESGFPYWRDETAGDIARQIVSIKQGNGDGLIHDEANTQCASSDKFWIISHSQGALQMMFIAGNALPGSPYF